MTRVGIADLKARLSEHIREVRSGARLTVLDRNIPVAQIVPVQQSDVEIRPASRSPRDVPVGAPILPDGASSLATLLDDRSQR